MKKLGIIIARFQVPTLHAGHIHFITEAASQSERLVIFLGYKINQPDVKNPFSLAVRTAMLKQALTKLGVQNKVIIDSIEDHPISNQLWSQELDAKIAMHQAHLTAEYHDDVEVSLFGSRDSFITSYFGIYKTVEIGEVVTASGTEMREKVLMLTEDDLNDNHREGIVYGLKHIYPVGMSVVDIVVYKKSGDDIYFLLGRKPREDIFRLFGGFFDVKQDDSLEDAALRELREEAGDIITAGPHYLTSKKIDDWRYKGNQHKIVSSLFVTEYLSGEPKASDDIEELMWVKREDLKSTRIIESHRVFIEKAEAYIDTLSA